MSIMHGRWRDPRLGTAAPREKRHATWAELFYDLVFVVLVARLAHRLGSHLDPAGVGEFLAWAVGLTIEVLTSVLAGDLHRRFPRLRPMRLVEPHDGHEVDLTSGPARRGWLLRRGRSPGPSGRLCSMASS